MWVPAVLIFGLLLPEGFASIYEAEENDNITISVVSDRNMICLLLSDPRRVFYRVTNGVQAPESPHQQFAGRLHFERDEGRVSFHLSRVTAEDSGRYRCYLAAKYNENLHDWDFNTTEIFTLRISQSSRGDNTDVSASTRAPQLKADVNHCITGSGHQQLSCKNSLKHGWILGLVFLLLWMVYLTYLLVRWCQRYVGSTIKSTIKKKIISRCCFDQTEHPSSLQLWSDEDGGFRP
ncbi:uncharacterized protein [Nothobranchius furzeri]|uniref:Transcript variant X1 n=1 Tax=Nothobranchius furzeri TaxID=105023 RepID=A0A1A8A5I3_NOTFU|nr:transcript variant X1 [Nothobranchius furzeri]KAF7229725.1 transcript variant X2 [Nothobranchius furzeri]KAF7229726.1 transcript variant X3 [Nothobranchius furzeri]